MFLTLKPELFKLEAFSVLGLISLTLSLQTFFPILEKRSEKLLYWFAPQKQTSILKR